MRARNRRGAEPLHAAVNGAPGSPLWDPPAQVEVLEYLIEAGADVEAAAAGGVTPLHRAVRNRCSAAVEVLLAAGADQLRRTARGATAMSLAQRMTGRGGTGSPEARREQERIVELLQKCPVTDQAVLHGMPARIRDPLVPLPSVRMIDEGDS